MTKYFVIGFNKTGTTSINYLFKSLKINSTHSTIPVLENINNYDAFTDGDHKYFEKYYEKYPDSIFILNTRPLNSWLISRYKHAEKYNFDEKRWCWPVSNELTKKWISDRERHYKKILNFFTDKPKQLLIVNIEKEGYEKVIKNFIGKKDNIDIIKSKKNVRRDEKIKHIKDITANVFQCLKKLNYKYNETLLKDKNLNKKYLKLYKNNIL
tara:strand:- start:576 stop:1208 length:633 start_codon:yes stop_codon:yes gene_type:complete